MSATLRSPRSVPVLPQVSGLPYDLVDELLAKFFLSSENQVLPGIRRKGEGAKANFDKRDTKAAVELELPSYKLEKDSVRPGKVDRGMPVYHKEEGVGAPTLVEGLNRLGYGLLSAGFYTTRSGKTDLWVVEFRLVRGQENTRTFNALNAKFLHYAVDSYTLDVWKNPSLIATANFRNRELGRKPSRKLVAGAKSIYIP